MRLLLRRKNRQEFCLLFSSSQWGWCLERRQVQDLARPAIIDSCACRPTDVQTHSLNTHRHTHGHPLGHRHSQTHNTRETRLSFSAFFLFVFFIFLFSQSAASHRFWLFALAFQRRGEKTRRRSSLMGGQRSSQVPCVLPLLFQTTITDNFLRFSEIVPVVLWPTVVLRICCQLARIESRDNLTSRNNNRNDGKKGTFSGAAAGAGAGAAAGGI